MAALALFLEVLHNLGLLLRKHAGDHFRKPKMPCHRIGGCAAVPCQHHHAQPLLLQTIDGFARRFLHGIRNANQACGFAIDGHEHHRLAISAHVFGARRECPGRNAQRFEKRQIAKRHTPPRHRARHAFASDRIEAFCGMQGNTTILRTRNDRRRQWMFAAAFQAGR